MKKLFFLIILIVVFWTGLLARPAYTKDFQLWTELKYAHPFGKSPWTLHWATENRFANNGTDYFLFNTTIGFDYKWLKWFKTGFFYRYEKIQDRDGENRIFPSAEFNNALGPIIINNRQRFEFRFFPDEFRFRYRPRIKISHPFKTSPVSFTPFVSNEFFVEPQNDWYNQNRFDVGNSFGFYRDHITFDLFYRLRSDKNLDGAGWFQNHILGTSLGLKF